ncbi:MAG: hypothetical protein E6Q27_00610 [Aeromicrobium sp.]|nr:MAG: hypothetical protein E6Q27_00610 [Aeromicrobium sp.]
MSSPQLGRDVYWRRRLLVLAVLIALIWGIVQLVGLVFGNDEKSEKKSAETSSAATPGPTDAPAENPEPTSELGQAVPISLITATEKCDPENVRILAMVPEGQQAGGPVNVEFLISSLDSHACTFTPAKRDLLVVIEANDKAVYDSSVCRESFLTNPVLVAQGFGTLVRTTWSGKGSGKACSANEGFVHGGTFVMKIGTLGGEPDTTEFVLAAAPKPTPMPTPTVSGTPTPTAPSSTPTSTPTPAPTAPNHD